MSSRFESITGTLDQDFPEYHSPPPTPMPLARKWITAAVEAQVREPLALALATSDRHGHTSNRIVAIVDLTDDAVVFTSHTTSRKARDIAETHWASGLLYWRETAQQLSISGPVTPLPNDDNDHLWRSRPPALHPMSAASRQSEPLLDHQHLLDDAARLTAVVLVPRPERFSGYRLHPHVVEFWSAADNRLHRRLRFDKTDTGWTPTILQP